MHPNKWQSKGEVDPIPCGNCFQRLPIFDARGEGPLSQICI